MTVLPAGLVPLVSDVVAERQRHLGRERTLKVIAALMGLSCIAWLLGDVAILMFIFAGSLNLEGYEIPHFVGGQVLSVFMLWGSWRLWRLDRWGLITVGVCAASLTYSAVVWVAAVPSAIDPTEAEEMATLVGSFMAGIAIFFGLLAVYLWWLTFSRKSRRVVSEQYHAEVMAQTPQISNRLATTTVVALLILTVFSLFSVVSAAL